MPDAPAAASSMAPSEETPLVETAEETALGEKRFRLHFNYVAFAISFGVSYAAVGSNTSFLDEIFPAEAATTANAVQYGIWCLSALFLASPFVNRFGGRTSLIIAQGLEVLVQIMMLVILFEGDEFAESSSGTGFLVAAMAFQGLAVAIAWVAQGVYFAKAALLLSRYSPEATAKECTARYASVFTGLLLLMDVIVRSSAGSFMPGETEEEIGQRLDFAAHEYTNMIIFTFSLVKQPASLILVDVVSQSPCISLLHGSGCCC